jgi:hypothetical protein
VVFPIIMIATTLIFFDLKALKQMPDEDKM